jgi:hypothetical protein
MILEMSGHPNFGLPNSLNLSHFESGPINNPQLTPNGQGENRICKLIFNVEVEI